MKLLILSPHIDDAFLSLGGFISKYSHKHLIEVVNIFSYDPWVLKKFDTKSKQKNILIRKKEEIINSKASETTIHFWEYPAGWKERGYSQWQLPIDKSKDADLLKKLKRRLKAMSKKFDLVFAPLSIGGHVDHLIVRNVVAMLSDLNVVFYEDLPYALEESFFGFSNQFISKNNLIPFRVILSRELIDTKNLLVSTYKSQLSPSEMKAVVKYSREKETPCETLWTTLKSTKALKPCLTYSADSVV